ncbi:MAG: PKD domain-containing protein [Saprospiraceae bacterium]|nr:PKD domain-containing protein [Lewinella sp.]
MKTIMNPKLLWALLLLCCSSLSLQAQFEITGRVVFGETKEPVPNYEVRITLPAHGQEYTVSTDDEGIYLLALDWTSAEILEAVIEVVDLCTGEIHIREFPDPNGEYTNRYIANFSICLGIDPPPPPPGCEAFFSYEQLKVNPPTVLFFDLSYVNDSSEVAYLWDFGDGTTSSEPAPTHIFPEIGIYEVTLTVRSENCTSTTIQHVILQETLDCVCPAVYNPVCVTLDDGTVITFGNRCEAECAGFKEGDWQACEPNECGCPEFYDPVCVIGPNGDSLQFSNICFAECAGYPPDQVEHCNPINECECPQVYDPVCVTNDAGEQLTFANECLARCAGYPADAITECNGSCSCPEYYDPVCVKVDGDSLIQFPNICFAECAGYGPDEVYACDEPCYCPTVIDPVCVYLASGEILRFENSCRAECAGYAPDQYQKCDPEPCICPEYYSPVCAVVGGDTLTFANICFAECEGFGPDEVFACNPNGACNCPDDYEPVCAVGGDSIIYTFQNKCIALCRGYSEDQLFTCNDPCACPDYYDPVCYYDAAGNKVTFPNRCEAMCAGVDPDLLIDCSADCICPDDYAPVCVVVNGVTRTFSNRCQAECAGFPPDQIFECEPKECDCPEVYSPVCIVTDFGPAYWFVNACEAECAGFDPDQYESCGPEDCICPAVVDPVCVYSVEGDSIWFSNRCEAICAGYSEDQIFKCDVEPQCNCDLVYDPVCIYTPGGTVIRFANACEARCAGYDEQVWVKCDDTYCRAQFRVEYVADAPWNIQFLNVSTPADSTDVKWLWDFGDGTLSEETHPFHHFPHEGVYEVRLTMTTASGCSSTYREQVVVGDEPYGTKCEAMFFFEQEPNDPYAFQFHDMSLGQIVSWQWYFGDGTTSNEPAPHHRYEEAGIYIVSLSVKAIDGCTNLISVLIATDDDIVYNPDCHALFLPLIRPETNQVSFLNFSTAGAAETHWDFGDGTTSDQLMPIHMYDNAGTYTVTLTVTSQNGCTSSYSATINVAAGNFTAAPEYEFRSTTDTDEEVLPSNAVKVFPNPVSTELWLDMSDHPGGRLQWRIFSLEGRAVSEDSENLSAGHQRLSILTTGLPSGVYALQVMNEQGMITKKFVKR